MDPRTLQAVPDRELLRRLVELVSQSRRVDAELVCHVGEVEARRLYAREASPSMFAYCIERLHLSEGEAYACIRVARAARRHPVLLEMLRDGRLHLSGLVRLVPHLTAENQDWLLERAVHKSKRQIEELLAELSPRPDVPTVVRRLPAPKSGRPASVPSQPVAVPRPGQPVAVARPGQPVDCAGRAGADGAAPELCPGTVGSAGLSPVHVPDEPSSNADGRDDQLPPPAVEARMPEARTVRPPATTGPVRVPVEPLSLARYKVQFTASSELRRKLERLQALMRSEVPDGDLAAVIDRAVSEKLERLEARRYARTLSPRRLAAPKARAVSRQRGSDGETTPPSRHIPAAVRRAVHERNGGRCGYVDEQGRRCSERDRLEFHHRLPFGLGGEHRSGNIGLLCKAHNLLAAEMDYGTEAVRRHLAADHRCRGDSGNPPGR